MNQELEQAIVKYGNEIWDDGYGQGVYEEQERIIKLLEDVEEHDWIEIRLDKLIALIKGEQK